MTRFEMELSNLRELIKTITAQEGSEFEYLLPDNGRNGDGAVQLRACVAQFDKGRVYFGLPAPEDTQLRLSDGWGPRGVEWGLQLREEGDRSVWAILQKRAEGKL
jgi:hypothetical protein